MTLTTHLALLLTALLAPARAHHVLCVFPVPSRSHNHLGQGIVNALLEAGHKVTWASPFPQKTTNPNLRYIDLSATKENMPDMNNPANHKGMAIVKEFARNISVTSLRCGALRAALVEQRFDAVVTEWFFNDFDAGNISVTSLRCGALRAALVEERFDAVVTEWFFNDFDAGYAAVQQAPWILLSGVTLHPHLEGLVDEVRSIPTHPLMMNDYPMPMGLGQRLVNTAFYLMSAVDTWLDQSSNAAHYTASFAPLAAARGLALPPFASAVRNISILLVNSHPSIAPARTLPPNVVEVAGYHIEQDPPALPKDLQDLLDNSPQGVIYFSMGSVVKSSALPERTQRALLRVLGGLPQTVLWKFERELSDVPKNVHVRAWMPQASILAHPNIKLFITHCGLLSTLEAAQAGVPLLAIPVFGDQPANAARVLRAGLARRVSFGADMADQVQVELGEMLSNESYYKRAKEVSKVFRNRPVAASKLVAHYIELAIDTKGAYHLRSPSQLYSWYQLWMLDQLAILALGLFLLLLLIGKTVRFVKSKVSGRKVKRS